MFFSYAKALDPDNWFVIDEETAEIKLNKKPDRESPFLVNGTYYANILAISKGKAVIKPLLLPSGIQLSSCTTVFVVDHLITALAVEIYLKKGLKDKNKQQKKCLMSLIARQRRGFACADLNIFHFYLLHSWWRQVIDLI